MKIITLILQTLIGIVLGIYILGISYIIQAEYFSTWAQHEHVKQMYYKIAKMTGQINLLPAVIISDDADVNAAAFTDKIVINQGIIDFAKNDDELAMVIGHEISHVILGHVNVTDDMYTRNNIQKMEADADKYGAFLMMQAGYDICTGRELWKRWDQQQGDVLIQDHPDFAYRYDQLNVNCKE